MAPRGAGRHDEVMIRARTWWPAWLGVHVVGLVVGLASQLRLVTQECPGCPAVFRLSPAQQQALDEAGGTVGQFRMVVAVVILGFAAGTYWLAWVLVRRSRDEVFPVVAGYLLVPLGTWRWIEDAATLEVGGPGGALLRIAGLGNYVAPFALFALFPDGRWRPSWSRWVVAAIAAWSLVLYASPLVEDLARGREPVSSVDGAVFAAGLVLVVAWQVLRYRSGDAEVRAAVRWVATALGAVLVVLVPLIVSIRLGAELDPRLQAATVGLAVLGFYLVVLALAATIVRHRLWDVDVIVNRVIVYGGLTLAILVFYVTLVAVSVGPARSYGPVVAASAAVVVALVLEPLRQRLQGFATRLLFGSRPEPVLLLQTLTGSTHQEPAAVLTAAAQTIAIALKLPRVSISIERPEGPPLEGLARREQAAADLTLPILVDGTPVGSISFALRRGQRRFTRADRDALAAVAAQAGATAAMVRLALDLQRSRGELVTAREEERRRMSRDLHDGLGPTLAGVAHRLEHLRTHLPAEAEATSSSLWSLEADVRESFGEVRRLVRGLRPPVLDQLGLVGAIEVLADDLGLEVEIAGGRPENLSAAVELAAYRIVSEALSNVRRHAAIDGARVTIDVLDDALVLEVTDGGRGLPDHLPPGVGLHSMHERAAELGGSCCVGAGPEGGTVISAHLPLLVGSRA